MHRNIEAHTKDTGEVVHPDKIANFSMAHKGECYSNSNLVPASAEEPHSTILARELLLDKNEKYVGNDRAIFAGTINADNDTRGPAAFIREQNRIIGESADDLAEYFPDKGHVMKNSNNTFHKVRDENKSFKGAAVLTNLRIKSLNADIKKVVDDYEENGYGNPDTRKACLRQLLAIVPHHCGLHDQCTDEKWCKFLKVQKEHPEWEEDDIAKQAAVETNQSHCGKNMSLSDEGIYILNTKIGLRFNEKTIDKIAGGGCSNLSENFWNMNTKFSQGKCLCLDHTDKRAVIN